MLYQFFLPTKRTWWSSRRLKELRWANAEKGQKIYGLADGSFRRKRDRLIWSDKDNPRKTNVIKSSINIIKIFYLINIFWYITFDLSQDADWKAAKFELLIFQKFDIIDLINKLKNQNMRQYSNRNNILNLIYFRSSFSKATRMLCIYKR